MEINLKGIVDAIVLEAGYQHHVDWARKRGEGNISRSDWHGFMVRCGELIGVDAAGYVGWFMRR